MSNIREDFIKARYTLATHPGRIKERLIAAGRSGLTNYEPESLPSELAEDYRDLVAKLASSDGRRQGDGFVEQTVNGLDEDEAVSIAMELMGFAHNLLNTPREEFNR